MEKVKGLLLLCCCGRGPREADLQVSCTSSSYERADVSSPAECQDDPQLDPSKQALDVQQSNLPLSGCGDGPATATLASCSPEDPPPTELLEATALPSQYVSNQPQRALGWTPLILEAIPFSVAVLSCDGKEVLHHCHGSDSGAAHFLTQTLDMSDNSSQHGSACTFLAALLGDLEEHALKTVRGRRSCWKGSVFVEAAAGESPYCSSISRGAQPSSSPVDPTPSESTPCAAISRCAQPSSSPVDPTSSESTAHHARNGKMAVTEMGKALSLPAELLHDNMLSTGEVTTAAARPAAAADAAILAELAGTAAGTEKTGTGWESFGTNLMTTDTSWKLPSQSWAGTRFDILHTMESFHLRSSFTESKPKKSIHWSSGVDEDGRMVAGSGCGNASSQPRQMPPRPCRSMSALSPRLPTARRDSLLMSENSIEQFIGGNELKTKSLLRSLAQQAQAGDDNKAHSSKKELVRSLTAETDEMSTDKASRSASSNLAEPAPTESMGRNGGQSFDVMLSLLKPADGERSPFLVVISNISNHSRARATLSALAESQLELLSGIMPQHAIQFLALQSTAAVPQHVGQLARAHKGVTLLFMDIVGFTQMSKAVEPQEVMIFLNTLFSLFDQLTNMHGVHKVETAGDCYIVGGGIMSPQPSSDGFQVVAEDDVDPAVSARQVMEFAKAMLEVAGQVKMPDTHQPVRIRVGLHTGNVVSGLIGSKLPKFSVFGDAMNTASRMESTGVPGKIHASAATQSLLLHEKWVPTGQVEVKGKGLMETFLWTPEPAATPSLPLHRLPPPTPSTGMLPCILLKQTQSLLKQMNTHTSRSTAQWMDESLPLVLGGESVSQLD